jgi:O-methyltransferase
MEISPDVHRAAALYLDLLKKCLTRVLFPDRSLHHDLASTTGQLLSERSEGRDWPTEAETMVGLRRLDNLEACAISAIENEIPGDLVEAGAWRGGTAILMRAVLKAYSDYRRRVFVADSFQGLPHPDAANYPQDAGDTHHQLSPYLGVSLEQVKTNFDRYGLLDDQVRFLPGWFKDTLPGAPIERIAVLRLDGDMYESTMDGLVNLYDKVSDGGFVIIDDYGALPNCRAAVEDFRRAQGIAEPVERIDWTGAFWQKGNSGPPDLPHLIQRAADLVEFDEESYLNANPDVAHAVRSGSLQSGKEHFLLYGSAEGRRFR